MTAGSENSITFTLNNLLKSSFSPAALTAIDIKAGDSYKVFIWDSNMTPLLKAFMGSDF